MIVIFTKAAKDLSDKSCSILEIQINWLETTFKWLRFRMLNLWMSQGCNPNIGSVKINRGRRGPRWRVVAIRNSNQLIVLREESGNDVESLINWLRTTTFKGLTFEMLDFWMYHNFNQIFKVWKSTENDSCFYRKVVSTKNVFTKARAGTRPGLKDWSDM